MINFLRSLIRVSAFFSKEIFSILRQPMLVLTLVLGPFLILLLFGIGFRNEAPVLRTLFVVPSGNSTLTQQIESYATSLGSQLIFMGTTTDRAQAREQLLKRQVDVVAVIPDNAYESIRHSQPVMIELDHYEIDPFLSDYIKIFGQVYVDEINRRLLRVVTEQGQRDTELIRDALKSTRDTVITMQEAMRVGDRLETRRRQQQLEQDVTALTLAVGATVGVAHSVQQALGDQAGQDTQAVLDLLSTLRQDTAALNEPGNVQNSNLEAERIKKIEAELAQLQDLLDEFQSIDPNVLISPFRSQAISVAAVPIRPSDFFAPAVIALLLQHLAVTFAALSIVHERQDGTLELFRVSPISAAETLFGKYLSYLLFAGLLASILTLAVVYGLGVPMLGDWLSYSLSLTALIFTALGIGFVISLIARTDSEAVQYAMIVLLTSVFFSGAFLRLETLWRPIQLVSWSMPATYGILLLQNIMLRGFLPNANLLLGLTGFGLGLFLLAWLLLRRLMARN